MRPEFLSPSRPSFGAQIRWRQPAEDDHQYGSEQQEAGNRQQRNGETLHNFLDLPDHEDRHDHASASGRGHVGQESSRNGPERRRLTATRSLMMVTASEVSFVLTASLAAPSKGEMAG